MRLTRLGATPPVVDLYQRLWATLDDSARRRLLDRLAVLTDGELAIQIAMVAGLASMSVQAVLRWVRAEPDPTLAAALAFAYETARPDCRASLVDKLRPYLPDGG
jgi:hypothetical protein